MAFAVGMLQDTFKNAGVHAVAIGQFDVMLGAVWTTLTRPTLLGSTLLVASTTTNQHYFVVQT